MRKLLLLAVSLLVIAPYHYGQTSKNKTVSKEAKEAEDAKETLALRRINLLTDLKALEAEVTKIDPPFARAVAKAEIADAAWTLDQEYAKKLLREAYDLTLQEKEEERESIRHRPLDASGPAAPDPKEIARTNTRSKIMMIASRDQAFVTELREYAKQQLGRVGESEVYASLFKQAMKDGNAKDASAYAAGYMEVDPAAFGIGDALIVMGQKDREAADKLVIQYVERMRKLEPSREILSHVYFSLINAVLANPYYMVTRAAGTLGGQEAIKATLQYVIESALQLEQRAPGTSKGLSGLIVQLGQPIQQYVPELMGRFSELQQIWRAQGWQGIIPTMTNAEKYKANSENLTKTASETQRPEDLQKAIRRAVSDKDFTTARKLLDLVPKGSLQQTLAEEIDYDEAYALARAGNAAEAEQLARRLNKSEMILNAYPVVIKACLEKKDTFCALSLVTEGRERLKKAQNKNDIPRSLAALAKAIAPIDEARALEVLDDAVHEANRVTFELTKYGYPGFSQAAFATLAVKHEARLLQIAGDLKDRFNRIVTFAVIYQAKAKELAKESEAEPVLAKN